METGKLSLLSDQARIQVPWVKVTIGNYTFGVFSKQTRTENENNKSYAKYNIQYPNYVQGLQIVKINGQVNQYTLNIKYPIRSTDDPNFFEKVFSSVSQSRRIVFSYGDVSMPTYIYKDEEAIISNIQQSFDLNSSLISYTVYAVSGAALKTAGCCNFLSDGALHKPSDIIKSMFLNPSYGLQKVFTGMAGQDLDMFIRGDDKPVKLETKLNISALDYILYLVSCMIPAGTPTTNISPGIYILTVHDNASLENKVPGTTRLVDGPYFQVTKMTYNVDRADAYVLDVGYNTSTLVSNFTIDQNENYSLYYDYQNKLTQDEYVRRINADGVWEDMFAPQASSKNNYFETNPADVIWWTKVTKYPINASVTIQGLLRPATLMSYLRLNVIFPGGHKHISSGLYIITKQQDTIDGSGYKTTLSLTKIAGDDSIKIGQ